MKRMSLIAVTGAALAAFGVAGCGDNDADEPSTTVVTTAPGSATVGTTEVGRTPQTNNTNAGPGGATGAYDTIADAVNDKIRTNTQMTGSRITAVADAAGVVTLTGTAQNPQQKALAERAARNTAGVTSVKNKVEIRPTGGAGKTPPPPPVTKTKVIVVPAPQKGTAAPRTTKPRGGDSTDTDTTTGTEETTTEPGADSSTDTSKDNGTESDSTTTTTP